MKRAKPKVKAVRRGAVQVWCIWTRFNGGALALPTVRSTKRRCIQDYMCEPGNRNTTWRQLKRGGWDCIPVLVTPLGKEK